MLSTLGPRLVTPTIIIAFVLGMGRSSRFSDLYKLDVTEFWWFCNSELSPKRAQADLKVYWCGPSLS